MKINKLMIYSPSSSNKNIDDKQHTYIITMLEIDKITRDFKIKMKNRTK